MKQCKAKSKRTKKRCQCYAVNGMNVCYHHGGILGSKKAQQKRRLAVLKQGKFTKEAIQQKKAISRFLKNQRVALKNLMS